MSIIRVKVFCILIVMSFLSCSNQLDEMILVEGGSIANIVNGEEEIQIKSFYISPFEVTNRQYSLFIKETKRDWIEIGYWGKRSLLSPTTKHPAIYVSWVDAIHYCNWLSTKNGFKQVYSISGNSIKWDVSVKGFRLLTSTEWEWAARGGVKTQHHLYSGSDNPFEVAVFGYPEKSGLAPVGTMKPNELGIYDMTGNAEEWCWDIYPKSNDEPIGIQHRRIKGEDPRIIRGGGYKTQLERLPKVWEYSGAVIDSQADYGFRIGCNAE